MELRIPHETWVFWRGFVMGSPQRRRLPMPGRIHVVVYLVLAIQLLVYCTNLYELHGDIIIFDRTVHAMVRV
jgi:hypothetical protein